MLIIIAVSPDVFPAKLPDVFPAKFPDVLPAKLPVNVLTLVLSRSATGTESD